jgi:hypothetical protein
MGKEIAVSSFLQDELRKRNIMSVAAVEAARWLDYAGMLKDSATRPGLPLRDMLRAGKIAGQRQEMNGRWFIDRLDGAAAKEASATAIARPSRKKAVSRAPKAASVDDAAVKRFAKARAKYKPLKVRYLLVAEAPPKAESGRFFYFENVSDKDTLFWETMKALYPRDMPSSGYPRHRKREFLIRFRDDGLFLLDAVEEPLGRVTSALKRRRIRESLSRLHDDLRRLSDKETKIVLISAPVYEVCAAPLKAAGFNVINEEMIDFPGSGCQQKFREKFRRLVRTV